MLGTFDLRLLIIRTAQAVRRDGVARTLRAALSYVRPVHAQDEFDLKYGTDTAGIVPLWRFKIGSPNARFGWRYQTSNAIDFERCLKCIPHDPRDFTFIDIGCGKGRMLIAAAKLGFQSLVGVEFVAELATIAKSNLARTGTASAVVINEDAADFHFPPNDFVLYMFNPFSDQVMQKVLENLRRARPGRGFVIYNNARCAHLLDSSGFLRRFASVDETRYPTIIWAIDPDSTH